MAASSPYDDRELFRRRVQQKLVDRFSEEDKGQSVKSDNSSQSVKKSPYSLQNVIWVFGAISVFYFSDFLSVIMYDVRIKQSWFWIGVIAFLFHVSIALFLVGWLSLWKKVHSDNWETMYPKAVPFATGSFIIGGICLSVALWPVWGFLTPVILGSLLMGTVVIIAMFG